MAGCSNCDSSFCSCLVLAGAGDGTVNVAVTGSGDGDDPYVVSATVNLCEAAGNLPVGGAAVAGTDRVMVVDGSTCTIKTLPAGGGGGNFGVTGDTGTAPLVGGDTLNVVGVGHVNTAVTTGPPGNVNVDVSFDEHYTVAGSAIGYSGGSGVLGVGGPYVAFATTGSIAINNPSTQRNLDVLLSMTSKGNLTCGGGGQHSGEVVAYVNVNFGPFSAISQAYVNAADNSGVTGVGATASVASYGAVNAPPGGSVIVEMRTETTSSIITGFGQGDASCFLGWVGGTNQ